MFPFHNIHKYTWISSDGKIHNQIHHTLIYKIVADFPSSIRADCDTDHYLVAAKYERDYQLVNK